MLEQSQQHENTTSTTSDTKRQRRANIDKDYWCDKRQQLTPFNNTLMAPKKQTPSTIPGTPTKLQSTTKPITRNESLAYASIVQDVWKSYQSTPLNLRLIDAFMAFLVFTGVTQFLYCVLVGNYPFNAFLSGFTATVGQFVLAGKVFSRERSYQANL